MARILITGSSDGIGLLTAKRLIAQGHQVILHARNDQRAADAQAACPGALACLTGDLSSPDETRRLARAVVNQQADGGAQPLDCVVHNAALGPGGPAPSLFQVNTAAPYVLTCLMDRPARLVYVSSGMHRSGRPRLGEAGGGGLEGSGYSDSKLHVIMMAKAFARRWAGRVESNALDPGWVPTKMGGSGAPGDVQASVDCVVMLALGEGEAKGRAGEYFQNSRVVAPASIADDVGLQERLLQKLAEKTGVDVPP